MLINRTGWTYLIVFNLFTIIIAFNVEELKWINYEVDILQTPVKRGEEQNLPVITMTSKYGQEYQCILPESVEDDVSERETINEKSTDIKELLKPIQSGSCLLKSKDWWTYEFCFGHYIKQFHIEDSQIVGQVITLGLYESDYDWDNATDQEKFKHVKQRYHSQYYTNGTKCDLTGQPRNAEVRIYCEEDAGDYIYRVDEPGTCSYIITVHTSRLCSHPLLKPLPSNKAHTIPCHPLLNPEQYNDYLQKLKEEKALAEEKRNQWLNDQQERLQVMKNGNLLHIEGEKLAKLKEFSSKMYKGAKTKQVSADANNLPNDKEEAAQKDKASSTTSDEIKFSNIDPEEDNSELVQKFLLQEYDREIEKLKTSLPPEKFAAVKTNIQKQFNSILKEAEEESNSELSDEYKDVVFSKLTSTVNVLLEKLDKAEKDIAKATKELNKATLISEFDAEDAENDIQENEDTQPKDIKTKKDSETDTSTLKVIEDDQSQTAILDDDKLHVRIRRLDRKSSDSSGKLYEMDFVQRKKLEQAVKEKLEKAGLDTGGRRIEVKIITAGYYDNEDGKDFHALSDEETSQFQNMIMALLTGQQEAVQEMQRHKKLEENYKFLWENKEESDKED